MRFAVVAIILAALLASCSSVPSISIEEGSVTGVDNAGEPATLNRTSNEVGFEIPAGSKYTITTTEPSVGLPRTTIEEWVFSAPSKASLKASAVSASTGKVDQTVAMHAISEESRKYLVYAGVGLIVLGAVLAFNPIARFPLWAVGSGVGGGMLLFAHQYPGLFYTGIGVAVLGFGIAFGGEIRDKMKKRGID